MARHTLSYMKTLVAIVALGTAVLAATHLIAPGQPGLVRGLIVVIGWSVGLVAATVAAGGILVLVRDHAQTEGRMDLFNASNESRSESVLTTRRPGYGLLFRQLSRLILRGRWLLVGDVVEIRSLDEIRNTLDASDCLDGLPFMPEMAAFCGQRAVVFRCVDKIYDYGRSKTLRRLKDVVLLAGLRCDGSAHYGCQTACYLLWKKIWLKPVARSPLVQHPITQAPAAVSHQSTPSTGRYTCQYTELVAASRPMARWDIRQDLRPLLTGNVTVRAFSVAMLTRLFNAVQAARGGVGYPSMARGRMTIASSGRRLVPGDTVRVLAAENIAATLDDYGRHRGLWFDRDMVKHCGRRYTVLRRVERIIDDATGQMLGMKTPCLVLAGVEASGEFLRFCAQQEYPFWREIWLSQETH